MTTLYWWRKVPNFGDALSPLLVAHYTGHVVDWAPAADADLMSCGSVLEGAPRGWRGIVAGSGRLRSDSQLNLDRAHILGVRGPLTAAGLKGTFALGDPGLLADELVSVEKEHHLGIVPHWSDRTLEHRPEFLRLHPVVIRPEGDPLRVVQQIGRCRKIVTSSLHGLILADAFGIPRRYEPNLKPAWEGNDFKVRDYCASIGLPYETGLLQEANRDRVNAVQQEVFDMFTELGLILSRR